MSLLDAVHGLITGFSLTFNARVLKDKETQEWFGQKVRELIFKSFDSVELGLSLCENHDDDLSRMGSFYLSYRRR